MIKRKISKLLICLGLLLCLAALLLSLYNIYLDRILGSESQNTVQELSNYIKENKTELVDGQIEDYIIDPNKELKEKIVNNKAYTGILYFKDVDKTLAVLSECNDENLKYAPCVYNNSPYKKGFIIGGHATVTHFGFVNKLELDSNVTFEDIEGNIFNYKVIQKDVLYPNQVKELKDENYDFTIFTCTFDNSQRYIVRLKKID